MKSVKLIVTLFVLMMLLSFASNLSPTHANGPRTEDVLMRFYSSQLMAYTALKDDEIDILAWPIDELGFYDDAKLDPNIVMSKRFENDDMYGFSLNLNETIDEYPHTTSPLTNMSFRTAIALLVNKDYIVDSLVGGFGRRIDVPVPYSQRNWWAENVTGENYPYEINKGAAAQILDAAGFIQGTKPNPDYDGYTYSAQYIRTFPDEDPWNGSDLHELIFCTPSNNLMVEVTNHLAGNMRQLGIPVTVISDASVMYRIPQYDFHIFTGYQMKWKAPIDLWLNLMKCTYSMLSWNHLLAAEENNPWYLKLLNRWRSFLGGIQEVMISTYLSAAEQSWKSYDYTATMAHNKIAQENYVNAVLGIPVWSTSAHYAWRSSTLGVVMKEGRGVLNEYTYMNAYRSEGGPLRIGLPHAPNILNVMHSTSHTDYYVLQMIYPELMSFLPLNRDVDQPWIVKDWSLGTWVNPETGENASYVDFWFRDDVYAAAPVTGSQDDHFDAYDFEFSLYYTYAQKWLQDPDVPHLRKIEDLHNVTVISKYHARVFFDVESFWAVNWPTYPILPKERWFKEDIPLVVKNVSNPAFVTYNGEDMVLPGYIPIDDPVVSNGSDTVVRAYAGTSWVPLEWGVDYEWRHGRLYVKVDSIGSLNILVISVPKFWTYGETLGYFPGAMSWQDIFVGYGPFYVTTFAAGTGGHIGLKRNAFFFLETPPLGEVDWAWKWSSGGGYKIDIFDVVIASSAYGSEATGVPSSNWCPAADLAPSGGKIDINDITAVTSHYGLEFGKP